MISAGATIDAAVSKRLNLGGFEDAFGEIVGKNICRAGLGPIAVGRLRDAIKPISDLMRKADGTIRRESSKASSSR